MGRHHVVLAHVRPTAEKLVHQTSVSDERLDESSQHPGGQGVLVARCSLRQSRVREVDHPELVAKLPRDFYWNGHWVSDGRVINRT